MEPAKIEAVSLFISAIAAVLTYTSMRRKKQVHLAKERLETVISPLFEILEPWMKAGLPSGLLPAGIEQAFFILRENPLLAGGKLREYRMLHESGKLGPGELPGLCRLVGSEYDRLSRSLDIPLRSRKYRKTHYRPDFRSLYPNMADFALTASSMVFTALTLIQILLRTVTPYGPNAPYEYFMVDHTVMLITSSIAAALGVLIKIRATLHKSG